MKVFVRCARRLALTASALGFAALVALTPPAALAGTGTITVKDSLGNTKTFDVITDGSGNFGAMMGVCDGTALAQCAAVKAASTAAGATDPALVVAVSPNNTVAATQSGTWTVQPGNTANTTAWLVNIVPSTTQGWTPILENALSTTVQTVKSSAGELGAYYCWNPDAAVSYIQIFDTSGTVTLGSTTPKWSIGIPATSAANLEFANGVNFANAIKVAATTTATGSTAPSTAVDCNFAFK